MGAKTVFLAALFTVGISADAVAQANRRVFNEGTFTQHGTCEKVVWLDKDRTAECEPVLLVVARQHDLPQFMFMLGANRSYVFRAARGAEFLDDNRTIRYQVARVVDLEARLEHEVQGECKLVILEKRHEAHCIAWRDKNPMAEARFVGDGLWWQKPR